MTRTPGTHAPATGFTLFDTAVGRCGIAWSARGVTGVQLPEGTAAATRTRLEERCAPAVETKPPAHIRHAIDALVALLSGDDVDLSTITLDMEGVPVFHQRVYAIARAIPPGATLSYSDVADRLGVAGSARAVGHALGHNPFPLIVPCHRVLAAGGRLGGFSAGGGTATKRRLLAIEGALQPTLF
jgi:methylated-DNA-[protein]-cysteine S-methyltransferase